SLTSHGVEFIPFLCRGTPLFSSRIGSRDQHESDQERIINLVKIVSALSSLYLSGLSLGYNSDFSMEKQGQERQIDPVMEAARGDPDDPLIASRRGRIGGWWDRNQDFIRRRAETLRRPAAQAEAEAERSREPPASKNSMAGLLVPAAAEVRDLECAVCLEDLVAGGRKLRKMDCSHCFHQRCIFRWLHVSRLCPMCRFAMPSRPDGEHVGDEVERELAAEEEDAADEEKSAAAEERSSGE
uniref:RING-type domain-containing protein n=2 Tax=Aegilops tauschii subsp. strangulata TaxID=200361 RepID=A0A453GIY4_AEGTS